MKARPGALARFNVSESAWIHLDAWGNVPVKAQPAAASQQPPAPTTAIKTVDYDSMMLVVQNGSRTTKHKLEPSSSGMCVAVVGDEVVETDVPNISLETWLNERAMMKRPAAAAGAALKRPATFRVATLGLPKTHFVNF